MDNFTTRHPILNLKTAKILIAFAIFILVSLPLIALGDTTPHSANSMMAESPVTSYTAGVMLYMLLVGFLVTFLLGGAFAVLSLGLMSKRNEDDKLGHWDPSDVAILREHRARQILPAEEGDYEDPFSQVDQRKEWAQGAVLVTEGEMFHEEKQAA
jgi:hypothetical protein